MILKRVLMPMLLLGIIFGLSSAAQAQVVTCSATATAATRATATGHTEPAGDLTVKCTSPGGLTSVTTSVLQIDYGVTNTSSSFLGFPSGRPVALAACTGSFTCS